MSFSVDDIFGDIDDINGFSDDDDNKPYSNNSKNSFYKRKIQEKNFTANKKIRRGIIV